jgi:hypothetical protein
VKKSAGMEVDPLVGATYGATPLRCAGHACTRASRAQGVRRNCTARSPV